MFKNFFYDLKLNRISYLLETIEKNNFKKKVDAYNKLKKIKIDEEIGHFIIDYVGNLKYNNDNIDTHISLLNLLFVNYYDSYSTHLLEIYKKLNTETKYELLNILANSNDPSELILYRIILFNYYKEFNTYPIGNIASNPNNYELIFPELYETFKAKNNRNTLLLLLSDFINLGIVPIIDLEKNKKVLQKTVINIFKETIKYKIDPKDNFMSNKEYIDLRIFCEIAVSIEYYVSNKETKTYLDKLYKTKDNQLKIFILENYIRKGIDISKININSIAKDELSRYPLYSVLVNSKNEKLMPKKYKNNKALAISDITINYAISRSYSNIPYDFELLEEKVVDDYKYYIYKFKTKFNYNEEIDPATDYLLKNIKMDKEIIDNCESIYIGISGGYNIKDNSSLIEKNLDKTKIIKYSENYNDIVDDILKSDKVIEEVVDETKTSKIAKIINFSGILCFICFVVILLFTVLMLYLSNIDLFNLMKNNKNHKNNIVEAVLLKPKDLFAEINYRDIFNREENEYYVLFFKKKDKSKYYEYLNTLLKNGYRIYYVDISKEDNKPIFEGNETGFVISEDTLLKVTDRDYNFYIIGQDNILKEFKVYKDEIIKIKEEEKKAKEKEKKAKEKAKEKRVEKKEN